MIRVMSRCRVLWLAVLVASFATGCVLSAQNQKIVVVEPGQNIQEIVAKSPQGTRFHFQPGVYRQQAIFPKDRQEFIGQDGVILSGAMVLGGWTRESKFWQTEGLPRTLRIHGECESGRDLCTLREDLFFNGRLYQRVQSVEELGPGRWYHEKDRAYLTDDPTGQLVELGVTPMAFGGNAEDVVLEDLVIEKYASDSQEGAIYADDTSGWLISNVTSRWNHGAGLSFGPKTHVKGGSFSHNGQIGIVGIGEGTTIEGVEIAFNNYAGYDAKWEAGGTKFWETKGLIVRDSCIHHNAGPGLWTDNDNIDVIYDGNKVFMNANSGIKHEISYDAIIRNNTVIHNGTSGFDDWLWGSQILIQDSSNVEVHSNVVEVSNKFGNGIGVIYQDRGDGIYGPWQAVNNAVHDNTIVHLGSHGQSGIVTDTDDHSFWKTADNRFDRNTYIVADRGNQYWTSNGRGEVWDNIEGPEFESSGQLIIEQRAPTELSCGQ